MPSCLMAFKMPVTSDVGQSKILVLDQHENYFISVWACTRTRTHDAVFFFGARTFENANIGMVFKNFL